MVDARFLLMSSALSVVVAMLVVVFVIRFVHVN